MSIYKFLERIRKQDDVKKNSFAFLTALFITLFIFAIWLTSLIFNLTDKNISNVASPINAFSNQVKSLFNNTQIYEAEN